MGRVGETFFQHFVATLGWTFRPVHQEDDFGIDGYIDVVTEGHVTGQCLAVQIKCGDSFLRGASEGGVKFLGSKRHLNYTSI
ncbi:MAG: DUF4365 domain-containing protein [Verrucomicrobiae bacterium]|nr:DUF4365 domain-containing protein [Verrucomicrobiae bacterium]